MAETMTAAGLAGLDDDQFWAEVARFLVDADAISTSGVLAPEAERRDPELAEYARARAELAAGAWLRVARLDDGGPPPFTVDELTRDRRLETAWLRRFRWQGNRAERRLRALGERRLRIDRHLSMREAAMGLGIDVSLLSRAEAGQRRPPSLEDLALFFSVSWGEILADCPQCGYRPDPGFTCQVCGTAGPPAAGGGQP